METRRIIPNSGEGDKGAKNRMLPTSDDATGSKREKSEIGFDEEKWI